MQMPVNIYRMGSVKKIIHSLKNVIKVFDIEEKCNISANELNDNELICSIADMMDQGEERVFNEACKQTNTHYHYNDYFRTVMSNKPSLPNPIRRELRKAFKEVK